MRGRALLMLLAGLAIAVAHSGCAQLESTRQYLMMNDRKDGTEDDGSEWAAVAREGRGDQPKELETDTWFDYSFHSKKYRQINSNFVRYH
jgi:hypothetical protein